jgi:predicted aldo/keto reductase-like oxidoreductase
MKSSKLNRRKFLRSASTGIIGAGLLGTKASAMSSPEPQEEFPKIKAFRTLGRTGYSVSDISTGYPFNSSVLKAVLSSGVNLIETSEMYGRGQNERMIGEVIKDFDREKLFIVTKLAYSVKEYQSVQEIIDRANASLERLQTDYIDCFMLHGAENSERVKNKYYHKAVEQLKKEGKIRFTGISCHGHTWWDNPEETFEQVLMTAVEDDRFDVIMLPYNFFEPEMGERVLKACREKNIGTMIMKSVPIVIYELFSKEKELKEKEGGELSDRYKIGYEKYKIQNEQAEAFFSRYGISGIEQMKDGAMQFILSNENVSTICSLFQNFNDVEKYIRLSGTTLKPETGEILGAFKSKYNNLHCRIGCNLCEASCPHHLPVNTILRYNYYFQSKKQEKIAIELYKGLPGPKPDICLDCEGHCENACPHGVLARPMLAAAHRNLSLNSPEFT